MKAVSIKQPWAHLIAIGLKDIENRSWPTSYRGRIFIHTSAKKEKGRNVINLLTLQQIKYLKDDSTEEDLGLILTEEYNFGAIIGEVDIIGCINNSDSVWAEKGQWHWQLANALIYPKPILNVKGKLSFWDFDPLKQI